MAAEEEGWHYLDANQTAQGPFPIDYLQKLGEHGYFNDPNVLFWREGEKEWLPLKQIPKLQQALEEAAKAADVAAAADGAAQPATSSVPQPASGPVQPSRRGAVVASAPAAAAGAAAAVAAPDGDAAASVVHDPELAGFLSEISAIEAETEAAAGSEDGSVPASPPSDERSFEDDDGTLYVWDSALRKFMPQEGGAAGTAAPVAYSEEDMVFEADEEKQPAYRPPPKYGELEDEANEEAAAATAGASEAGSGEAAAARPVPAAPAEAMGGGKFGGGKRDAQAAALEQARERAKKAKEVKQQGWVEKKVNTSVYVQGLPDDVTEAELVEVFAKCGVIKEDEQGNPRVKVYRDRETGRPKGDGLVTFLKEPSVALAMQLLDSAPLRYGLAINMKVSQAQFEQKGEFRTRPVAARKAAKRQLERLEHKALGWGGFDDVLPPQQVTVILRHMFEPSEFAENPFYREELERDLREEAGRLGKLEKLRIYASNPDGVVSLKFATQESADECVALMNGRFFAGRKLAAHKWDGKTNYNVKVKESEEEQAARLERFAAEIEAGGTDGAAAPPAPAADAGAP